MTIKQNLCPSGKYSVKCPYPMTPIGVCIHNTANDASAANEIKYMLGNNNKVSYHYAVDDKEIIQAIPNDRNAWHAGDGGSGAGNRKYISVEICYSKSGGARFEAAMKNAAWLTAKLLKDYGWDISHVKKHQDFSGKYCPHRILSDYGWDYFLNLVKAEMSGAATVPTANEGLVNYTVKVTADTLNVRDGAGTNYPVNTSVTKGGVYTVVEKRGNWGLLKSGAGWIHMGYVTVMNTAAVKKITSFDEAVNKLVEKGVMNTGAYWTANSKALPYLEKLIIAMANTNLRAAERNGFASSSQALAAMTKAGVIDSPDYWTANIARVKYLDELIVKFANRLWV